MNRIIGASGFTVKGIDILFIKEVINFDAGDKGGSRLFAEAEVFFEFQVSVFLPGITGRVGQDQI